MTHRHLPGVLLVALVALTTLPVPGHAQLVDEEYVGRLTIGVGIGAIIPSMHDVNNNIRVVNPFLHRDEIRTLNPVREGLLTHMDVRYRLGHTPKEEPDEPVHLLDRVSVGFSWGAMNARSEINNITRVAARFYSRATTYYPYVLYHLPFLETLEPRAQLMVGGGPIFLRSGHAEWNLKDNTTNTFIEEGDISELAGTSSVSATGTGLVLQGSASYQLNHRFSVAMDFGYRKAVLKNLSLDQATGQDKRFPGDDSSDPTNIVRRPGDWSVIDFWKRDPKAVFEGRNRTDPVDNGGCQGCPLYYTGGDMQVDYSGPFITLTLRSHF